MVPQRNQWNRKGQTVDSTDWRRFFFRNLVEPVLKSAPIGEICGSKFPSFPFWHLRVSALDSCSTEIVEEPQFSQSSPGIEVWEANENASHASRASRLSAIIPGDLPLVCFGDSILSVQLLDDDTIGVPSEVYGTIPQLMTEAPKTQPIYFLNTTG